MKKIRKLKQNIMKKINVYTVKSSYLFNRVFFTIALCAMFFLPSILGWVGGRFLTGGAGLGFAQSPNYLWAKSAGGTDYDGGRSVATDASGNCFVTGIFYNSSITFGSYTLTNASADTADIFLAKLDNTNGINEELLLPGNIVIYPNPNTGLFTLSFTALQGNEAEIKVLDVLGKTVYCEKSFITQNKYFKEIELGKIFTGIYIVQVKVGEKIINRKIIIE